MSEIFKRLVASRACLELPTKLTFVDPSGAISMLDLDSQSGDDRETENRYDFAIVEPAILLHYFGRNLLQSDARRRVTRADSNTGLNAVGIFDGDPEVIFDFIRNNGWNPSQVPIAISLLVSGGPIVVRTEQMISIGETVRFSNSHPMWVESGIPLPQCAYGIAASDALLTRMSIEIQLLGTTPLPQLPESK